MESHGARRGHYHSVVVEDNGHLHPFFPVTGTFGIGAMTDGAVFLKQLGAIVGDFLIEPAFRCADIHCRRVNSNPCIDYRVNR